MNIAPILWLRGKVRSVTPRYVEPVDARPEERDENGNILKVALPAREGYEVHDVVLDTDPGGLLLVVFREEAVEQAGGYLPETGDHVDIPVRAFDAWKRGRYGRYRENGYSFAGQVYAETASTGLRVASNS